jgi:hypothetical protein
MWLRVDRDHHANRPAAPWPRPSDDGACCRSGSPKPTLHPADPRANRTTPSNDSDWRFVWLQALPVRVRLRDMRCSSACLILRRGDISRLRRLLQSSTVTGSTRAARRNGMSDATRLHSCALVWPCTAIDSLPVPYAGRNVCSEISDGRGAIGGADSAAQSSSDVVRSPA